MFPISDSIKARIFPAINISIIAFTIVVFLKQLTVPDPEAFIRSYALIPALVDFNRASTLIPFVTAIFLHGGFLHIISNLWFLWVFGDNVEDHLGWFLYPFIYLVTGVLGNLFQYFMMPDSTIPMLGASGAIAGVLGAYFILFPYSKIKTAVLVFLFITIINVPAPFMLGYWFILQLVSGAVSLPFISDGTGGIAFFAHIGGFVFGAILARIFK